LARKINYVQGRGGGLRAVSLCFKVIAFSFTSFFSSFFAFRILQILVQVGSKNRGYHLNKRERERERERKKEREREREKDNFLRTGNNVITTKEERTKIKRERKRSD